MRTRDFGLMQSVQELSVNAQVEDTGLRTQLKWTWTSEKE